MNWLILVGLVFAVFVLHALNNIADEVHKLTTTVEQWAETISKNVDKMEGNISDIEREVRNTPTGLGRRS